MQHTYTAQQMVASPTAKMIIANCYEMDLFGMEVKEIAEDLSKRYQINLTEAMVVKAIQAVDSEAEIASLMVIV